MRNDRKNDEENLRIAVVGPCGSGKSTLVKNLRQAGYDIHAISQEHSYIPNMWQRINPPDILIYLDASLATIAQRRQVSWGQDRLDQLKHRLRHAREHCDFYLNTDGLSIEAVVAQARKFIDPFTS